MPDESRVVVLDVDLSCSCCDKKIRKVLEKNREEWNIRNISYDVKNKEVKISGPFDPHQLVKKLCKRASDVIREWCIKEPEKPKPPPPKPEPPKPDPTPPPPKPEPPKPDPPKPEPPKPEPPKPEPPKPPKPEPPKPCPDPPCHPTCYPLPYPYPFPYYLPWGGCDGHHKPCSSGCGCSGGCDGHHKPCSSGCGCSGGCSGTYQPQPTYVDYGRPRQWVCEEEPAVACNIM